MKMRKVYFINDGLDGVYIAKGKNHLSKLVSKAHGVDKNQIKKQLKNNDMYNDFTITDVKKYRFGKSGCLGFVGY